MIPTAEGTAVLLARECLYRFLAASLSDPYTDRFGLVLDQRNQRLAAAAADLLRHEAGQSPAPLGIGELPPSQLDLTTLLVELERPLEELRADYDRVFGLVQSRECPPYETEYHASTEPFFRTQQLADVAGFYRAFGLQTARAAPERPDHIAAELEFMAFLALKERLALESAGDSPDPADQAAVCAAAQRSFCGDHLAWWVPSFAMGLRRKAGQGLFAAVGKVLAAFVAAERVRFGLTAPRLPLQPASIERPEEQSGCLSCVGQP
jgi:DMSO reductase family type II enzyme chaperone